MAVTFSFRTSVDDLQAAVENYLRTQSAGRRAVWMARGLSGARLTAMFLATVLFMLEWPLTGPQVLAVVATCLLLGVILETPGRVAAQRTGELVQTPWWRLHGMQPMELVVGREALEVRRAGLESRFGWDQIGRVAATDRHIFLFDTPLGWLSIPLSALEPERRRALLDAIRPQATTD